MTLLSFRRSFREFTQTIWRNRYVSLATVLAMAMVFSLTALVFTVNNSSERIIAHVEAKVDIGIFFQKEAHQYEIDSFLVELDRLKADGKIKNYTYYSAEFALEEMKKKFPEKVRFLERYQFENPLQASVEVVPATWQTKDIFTFLGQPQFRNVIDLQFLNRYEEKKQEVERILRLLSFVRRGGIFLVAIFVAISGFLIGFFVSSTLNQKKREIFIMRLVGAPHSFIRLPFILEGVTLALLGFLLSFVIFRIFLEGIAPKLVGFFATSADQIFMSELIFEVQSDFAGSFWLALLLILSIASVISWLTVERFMKRRQLFASE